MNMFARWICKLIAINKPSSETVVDDKFRNAPNNNKQRRAYYWLGEETAPLKVAIAFGPNAYYWAQTKRPIATIYDK